MNIKSYDFDMVYRTCGSVVLFIISSNGKLTYRLEDLDNDIDNRVVSNCSSLNKFHKYCLDKYGSR